MSDIATNLQNLIDKNDIILFMKGSKEMPQCGFSARVAGILNYVGVSYKDVDVLQDNALRQGIKDFSNWPTVPQLYVKGEFIGGCDIVTEMVMSGELDTLFDEKQIDYDKTAINTVRSANG